MKNFFTFLLSAIFLLTVVSCNRDNDSNNGNGDTPTIPVSGVTLTPTSATLVVGDTLFLSAIVQPTDATNQTIGWSTTTDAISVVGGMVIADSVGVANIVVTTEDGNRTASCGIAVVATQRGCNQDAPGWGENLGTVSFHGQGHNVEISGNGITQIWSGAVTATNCDKTTFSGGSADNFNADCRSNSGFPGDLFSWCAVVRFADILCPYPWRVPTVQDFINLDRAMGGSGSNTSNSPLFVQNYYITLWGGAFGGSSNSIGALNDQDTWGGYWSQTETGAMNARLLVFSTVGHIDPQGWNSEHFGLTLRCIR